MRAALGALLAVTAGLGLGPAVALARMQTADSPPSHTARAPRAGRARGTGRASSTKRAPRGAPLGSGLGTGTGAGAEEEASASAPPSGGDPLAGNGLNSPLCRDAAQVGLSGVAARNCRVSGFEAAQAPTGDYAFDVHIDTGVTKLGNDLATWMQNLTQFGWTALVAAVHGLIVVLDWCFTIDLLGGPAMSGLTRSLRETQATFTQPWLALVLAGASVLAAYHGLIRRRVAQTLGEALLMGAMMAGGLWVIADPTGTVGALSGWANEASLGTLGAVVAGTPDHPARTLADSTGELFDAAIDDPWCYLEFGDVRWCTDPARLDPRLRAAALKLAGERAHAFPKSAALLRDARTNGDLFLALPANQVARNSIRTQGSLFNVLCGGEEEPCKGPTAAQAEFRTQSGTGARLVGLFFIWVGALGMLLLLGFIGLRLLEAALMSLMYLLLAPAAVLAPALGEGGRAAFRRWAMGLLGAVTSKLVFSFLLGAVLTAERVLLSVRLFGWWTQWLLVAALWWGAYKHRHQALGVAEGALGGRWTERRSVVGRVSDMLETRKGMAVARWAKGKLSKPASNVERGRQREQAGREWAQRIADGQVAQSLERELDEARAKVRAGPLIQVRLSEMRGQLARVRGARREAIAAGDKRRAALLGVREGRIAGEIERGELALSQARRTVAASESVRRRTGESHTREQREELARLLDTQAALPAGGRAGENGQRRDYAALAGLAGHRRAEYERLDPRRRREARVQIDRELAKRRELGGAAADVAATAAASSSGPREKRSAGRELDRALAERLRAEGHSRASALTGGSRLDAWKREGSAAARARARGRGSPVLDDAREVAARRKRQLGRDRR